MNDFYFAVFAMLFLGGVVYFWYKCQMFAVSKLVLLIGLLVTPVGACVGIFWAVKDFFLFRKNNSDLHENSVLKEKNISGERERVITNEMYLDALEEYESGKKDKALYARIFAENEGKEEIVKAKYITYRVKQMLESK
jgi:hypothetical protein